MDRRDLSRVHSGIPKLAEYLEQGKLDRREFLAGAFNAISHDHVLGVIGGFPGKTLIASVNVLLVAILSVMARRQP